MKRLDQNRKIIKKHAYALNRATRHVRRLSIQFVNIDINTHLIRNHVKKTKSENQTLNAGWGEQEFARRSPSLSIL